jgi:uncharacterized protein (DUF2252 family)
MSGNDVVRRIERYNRGREPERLAIKYARMRASPFVFLRGTAHLFYEDLPRQGPLNAAPKTWLCGDLHLENFGGYDAAGGREHFDVTDFDEAALAPVTWELTRLCVSLLLAGKPIVMESRQSEALVQRCIDAYATALAGGALTAFDDRTSQPDLRKFLHHLSSNHPDGFLEARTTVTDGRRQLRMIKNKTLAAKPAQVKNLQRWWKTKRDALGLSEFGQLLDVARRVTGTGSLGVHRYALLVATAKNVRLLELKQAVPAAMIQQHRAPANPWRDEATRVTTVQRRAQAAPPALLADIRIGKDSFILRELHPGDDKLTVSPGKAQRERLARLAPWLGRLAAAGHRRTAGWKGAGTAAQLARFAKAKGWREHVDAYARSYAKVVERDWRLFRKATRARSKA